jgi:hypothetical protein
MTGAILIASGRVPTTTRIRFNATAHRNRHATQQRDPVAAFEMWFYGSMIHAIKDDVFLGFTVSSVMYFPTSHDVASGNAHRRHIHSITKRDVADALHCRAGNQGDSASELLRARR